jgi:hypothetical protein
MHRLTAKQAKAFRQRWATINAAEIAELRASSLAGKFRQLVALMSSARSFGWHKPLADDSAVRARWRRLRRSLRG